MTLPLGRWLTLVFLAVAFIAAPACLGQDQSADPGLAAGDPGIGDEVQVSIDSFGVGGAARPGDWVGLRIRLQDQGARQREILVRVSVPDEDGDQAWYERTIASNPPAPQAVWIYVRLPFWFEPTDALTVTAHAAIESTDAAAGDGSFTAGRILGRALVQAKPAGLTLSIDGLLGVVGRRALGWQDYATRLAGEPFNPTGHERTEVVTGLDPAQMPDRWMGLSKFDAILWAGFGPGAEPSELTTDRAQAIREWVERGGHLVIALPAVGQTWAASVNNELSAILPRVQQIRREGVDLEPYRPMLTTDRDPARQPLPRSAVITELLPEPGAFPHEAIVILRGPAQAGGPGPCVVARRLVGAGAVTLVGLDLSDRALLERGLPEADALWHRVLGRRGDALNAQQLAAAHQERSLTNRRELEPVDRDFSGAIAKTGRAAAGVLLGFVVFLLYWAAAGPAGFAVLKRMNQTKHAWLAFAAAAAVFTAIAWGGATAIRPKSVQANHLTLLYHIYGQPVQRARSWMSILVPTYGEAEIAVGEPDESPARERWHNTITPWESPDGRARGTAFPDARGYSIQARQPDRLVVPARATVKTFQVDWAGGPRWRMPLPVADGDAAPALVMTTSPEKRVVGKLAHQLPAPLHDLVVVVNWGQASLRPRPGRELLADVSAWVPTLPGNVWRAGDELDLAKITAENTSRDPFFFGQRLLGSRSVAGQFPAAGNIIDNRRMADRLKALAFFPMLDPPDYRSGTQLGDDDLLARRRATHGYDLGTWFTQPCVIIVGFMGDVDGASGQDIQPADSPVPVMVNGSTVVPQGRTLVMWVYPMPGAAPAFTDPLLPASSPSPPPPPPPAAAPGGE